jgi:hypothetical protein
MAFDLVFYHRERCETMPSPTMRGHAADTIDSRNGWETPAHRAPQGAQKVAVPFPDAWVDAWDSYEYAELTDVSEQVLKLERQAADRLRAAEWAMQRAVRTDREAARDHEAPETQALRVRERNAAAEVAQREQAEARAAAHARAQADADVVAAHQAIDAAREALVAAKEAAAKPGRAPRTTASLWLLGVLMLQFDCQLSEAEMDVVTGYIITLAERCGAARIIEGRERDRVKAELSEVARGPGQLGRGSLSRPPRPLPPKPAGHNAWPAGAVPTGAID